MGQRLVHAYARSGRVLGLWCECLGKRRGMFVGNDSWERGAEREAGKYDVQALIFRDIVS